MTEITEQNICEINYSGTGGGEALMRRILRIPEINKTGSQERRAEHLFSFAMVISALRCTLSYVILPFVLPALGLGATVGLGPYFGIPIGVAALYFDIKGIRRFWVAGHRLRWQMTVIYLLVIGLVLSLVIGDVLKLA